MQNTDSPTQLSTDATKQTVQVQIHTGVMKTDDLRLNQQASRWPSQSFLATASSLALAVRFCTAQLEK